MSSNCNVSPTSSVGKFQYRPYGNMFDGTGYDVNNPTGKQAASLFANGLFNYESDYFPPDYSLAFNPGGMMMGGYAGMPGMFPMGGYMPGFTGGYGPADYMKQMQEYQKQYSEYMVEQQKLNRNAELRVNAPMEGIQGAVAILKDKVMRNEQDQIATAFENLTDKVRAAYGNDIDESEARARAITTYQQLTGKNLFEDIRENGRSSFTQGMVQSATFGLDDHYSAEDTVSRINGSEVASGEKIEQNVGRVVGGATIGAITGTIASGIESLINSVKTAPTTTTGAANAAANAATGAANAATGAANAANTAANVAKKGGKKGVIIGLIIGTLATALSFLTGKSAT